MAIAAIALAILACIHLDVVPTRNPYAIEYHHLLILLAIGLVGTLLLRPRARLGHKVMVTLAIPVAWFGVMSALFAYDADVRVACGAVLVACGMITIAVYDALWRHLRDQARRVPHAIVVRHRQHCHGQAASMN